MDKKIECWRLYANDEHAWNGEINVTLNQYDLKILASALNCAEYEGSITKEELDHTFNKLNISLL